MDREHKNITEEEVKNGDYDLIIYVMNVTQFAIDDDSAYLELIKEAIANKNILFVLNKVDCLNPERENLYDFIKKAQSYLEKRGFLNPIICPLSAKVGISSKCVPRGDIDYIDYLAMTRRLKKLQVEAYYKQTFPEFFFGEIRADERLKVSGLYYLERIIMLFYMGVINQ